MPTNNRVIDKIYPRVSASECWRLLSRTYI